MTSSWQDCETSNPAAFTVSLLVLTKMIETGISIASSSRGDGIDFFQIPEHFHTRTVQTVQVEPIETYLDCIRPGVIEVAKPADKCFHIPVTPHPNRESGEDRKCLRGR